MTSADFSEVRRLAQDIGKIPGRIVPEVRGVVEKAAVNVKKDTRARISNHPSWKHLEHKVTYGMFGLAAEIGYEDSGQGELAGIHEFGTAKRAPHPALIPAANEEVSRFERALEAVKGWEP